MRQMSSQNECIFVVEDVEAPLLESSEDWGDRDNELGEDPGDDASIGSPRKITPRSRSMEKIGSLRTTTVPTSMLYNSSSAPLVTSSPCLSSSPSSNSSSGSSLRAKLKKLGAIVIPGSSSSSLSSSSEEEDEGSRTKQTTNPIFRKFISKDTCSYKYVKSLSSSPQGSGADTPIPLAVTRSKSTSCLTTKITRQSPSSSPPRSPRSPRSPPKHNKRRASLPTKFRTRTAGFSLTLPWTKENKNNDVQIVDSSVVMNPLLDIIRNHVENDDELKQTSASLRQVLTKLVNATTLKLPLRVPSILENVRALVDRHIELARRKVQFRKAGGNTMSRMLRYCKRLDSLYSSIVTSLAAQSLLSSSAENLINKPSRLLSPTSSSTLSTVASSSTSCTSIPSTSTVSMTTSLIVQSNSIANSCSSATPQSISFKIPLQPASKEGSRGLNRRNRGSSTIEDDTNPFAIRFLSLVNKIMACSAKIVSLSHRDSSRKLKKIGFAL